MRLGEVRKILDAELVSANFEPDIEIVAGSGADLLSDVLSYTQPGSLLLTGLINPQVLVTAEVVGVVAVAFVRGKRPPSETVRRAEERGIPLLSTHFTMFEACGRLFAAGLAGCDRWLSPQRRTSSA